MGHLCNAESAIATCDSINFPKNKGHHNKKHNPRVQDDSSRRRFDFLELDSATDHFSPHRLLGRGSHGSVYLAILDHGRLLAAVKKTKSTHHSNEREILSEFRSPMIVNLIGYSQEPTSESLLLVSQYMKNGSLYDHIHKNQTPPAWATRVKHALHIAKALGELHALNPPVIHRDIKSTNILVDKTGNARVSDFGLAIRLEEARGFHTRPAGTLGYIDPWYLGPGNASERIDVYSFGVLLLEIITGRKAIDMGHSPASVVEWAVPLIESRSAENILDRRIERPADPTVVWELKMVAARCVGSRADKRPSMGEVVASLEAAYKRVKFPVWGSLQRRVRRVEESWPLLRSDSMNGEDDGVQGMMRERGSRRSTAKVSSVVEEEGTRGRY
ncbi:hypothetical protein Droror1_Dr00027737 [Drosera rotundifolia]